MECGTLVLVRKGDGKPFEFSYSELEFFCPPFKSTVFFLAIRYLENKEIK